MRRVHLAAAVLALLLPIAVSAKAAAAPAKAPATAPPPSPPNITAAMEKGGCKAFAALLSASPDASSTFQSAIDGGVTAFCPSDGAVKPFLPRYKNLTAAGKAALLLSHAVPVYYTRRALKSNNGVMSTLATDAGAGNFNLTVQNVGDQVSVKTGAAKGKGAARVGSTVYDKEPVAVYAVDAVLEPVELFEPAEADAPAPAPAPAPAKHKKAAPKKQARHRDDDDDVADAPGPDADDDDDAPAADQRKSSKNGAARLGAQCLRWLAVVAVAAAAVLA